MATNGASARQWLAENGEHTPLPEVERIRNAIAKKLDTLSDDHPEQDGLLEALDAMDEWLVLAQDRPQSGQTTTLPSTPVENTDAQLDSSSLTPDLPPAEALSPEEKKARFQNLLQRSQSISKPPSQK